MDMHSPIDRHFGCFRERRSFLSPAELAELIGVPKASLSTWLASGRMLAWSALPKSMQWLACGRDDTPRDRRTRRFLPIDALLVLQTRVLEGIGLHRNLIRLALPGLQIALNAIVDDPDGRVAVSWNEAGTVHVFGGGPEAMEAAERAP